MLSLPMPHGGFKLLPGVGSTMITSILYILGELTKDDIHNPYERVANE
jgi:hypothetical protein